MSLDLFKDLIPSIMQTKEFVIKDAVDEKDYNSFMVNKALSFHPDCIFYANQMNIRYDLPKLLQYQYFMRKIRAQRRPFVQWSKKKKDEDIKLIQRHYNYSQKKAIDALNTLTEEQIQVIRDMYKHI